MNPRRHHGHKNAFDSFQSGPTARQKAEVEIPVEVGAMDNTNEKGKLRVGLKHS
jgi:hypothetical protein